MKRFKIFFLVIFLLSLTTSMVFAENQTWADRNFNFSGIQNVYMEEPTYSDDIDEEITQRLLCDAFYDGSSKVKNGNFFTARDIKSKLLRYKLVDLDAIIDESERDQVWQDAIKEFSDVWIKETIQEYWIDKVWKDPYYYTTTEYRDYSYWVDGKKYEVKVPETVEHYVEGKYLYIAHIRVKFEVFTTADNILIYSYVDYREAEKDLIDMYKRIVKDFYAGFGKKIK